MRAVPKLDESESGQMVSEKVKLTYFDVYLRESFWLKLLPRYVAPWIRVFWAILATFDFWVRSLTCSENGVLIFL